MENLIYLCFFGVLGISLARQVYDDNRIVGGEPIRIEDAPYQVSLQQRGHVCGATIVSDRFVVTAAHCVGSTSGYTVRVGSASLAGGGTQYDVQTVFVHPNNTDLDYDVALLKLRTAVVFGDKVGKAEMIDSGKEIEGGSFVKVVGWGVTEEGGGSLSPQLLSVTVPALTEQECTRAYRGIFNITPRMLCAGTEEGGKDSCQGDSGGVLTYRNQLARIASFGLGCARPGYPGVYTKVAAVRSWIDDVIKRNSVRCSYICLVTELFYCAGDSGGGLTYRNQLAGIVSFGLGCARPGYPGIYTNVAAVRSWIDVAIKRNSV